jgi:hypothetical protein
VKAPWVLQSPHGKAVSTSGFLQLAEILNFRDTHQWIVLDDPPLPFSSLRSGRQQVIRTYLIREIDSLRQEEFLRPKEIRN